MRLAEGAGHRRGAAAALAVGVTFALVVILGIAILAFGGGNDGDSAPPIDSSAATPTQVTDGSSDPAGEDDADDAADGLDDPERSREAADVSAATVVAAVTTAAPATEPPTTPAATTPPATTPPTTAPPAAPTTAPAPSPVQSSPPPAPPPAASYVFPFHDFFAVPQLGTEHVRGTGCGGGGEIEEVIPDGIWHGIVANLDESARFLDLDLYCIYHGTAADEFIADFIADGQSYVGDREWLPISNSPRTRRVPLDPSFVRRQADWIGGTCVDAGPDNPPERWYDVLTNWLAIEDGRAVFLLTGCSRG